MFTSIAPKLQKFISWLGPPTVVRCHFPHCTPCFTNPDRSLRSLTTPLASLALPARTFGPRYTRLASLAVPLGPGGPSPSASEDRGSAHPVASEDRRSRWLPERRQPSGHAPRCTHLPTPASPDQSSSAPKFLMSNALCSGWNGVP